MAAYFDGKHHPQKALLPRIGYLALHNDAVIGYIAGHRTTRFGCDGEVQYLFVAPAYRRQAVATRLLRLLTRWFAANEISKVCVNVDIGSPPAQPFYASHGAVAINKHWYMWPDIGVVLPLGPLDADDSSNAG